MNEGVPYRKKLPAREGKWGGHLRPDRIRATAYLLCIIVRLGTTCLANDAVDRLRSKMYNGTLSVALEHQRDVRKL
jgi:hypothetical protein